MNYAAVDFETYYDDECTIKKLGVDGYCRHPKFDAYLVSIVASTGLAWVGHPSEAPWHEISGQDWEWLAHNAGFDERVFHYLRRWGKARLAPIDVCAPGIAGHRLWHCTADLCAFSSAPRSLADASLFLYNEKVSKTIRDRMKGKVFSALSPEQQEDVRQYALKDARMCLRLWQDLSPKWPEPERRVSRLSRQQSWRGLRLDREGLEQDVKLLGTIIWVAEQMIPWHGVTATMGYESLVAECRKVGIDAPPATAMTSEECAAWEDKYGDQYPWIDAMRTARRANMLLKKAQLMLDRIRPEDGRMPYENKYFGAHTGRWGDGGENTGRYKSGGFNSRNLPRKEMFGEEFFLGKLKKDGTREEAQGKRFAHVWKPGMKGVNLRNRIIPEPGCHFPIADLSAIEPRALLKLAEDEDSLKLLHTGMHPYEVHARASMGYISHESLKKKDPSQYQLAKARVLALGYQAGWVKFILMAPTYIDREECDRIFGAPVTEQDVQRFKDYLLRCKVAAWNALWAKGDEKERLTYVNSWLIVSGFRKSNPKIVALWDKMKLKLNQSIGEDLEIVLPSGRSLLYRNVAREDGEIKGTIIRNGKPVRIRLYGGKLVENLIQATARDIFVECLLRLDDAGHWVALHAHDEAVPEVPLRVTTEEIEKIMSIPPSWMPDLPLASECESHMHYTK